MNSSYYGHIANTMEALAPDVGDALQKYARSDLATYASSLWTKTPTPISAHSRDARRLLLNTLAREVGGRWGPSKSNELRKSLDMFPVLQTGFHSQLLVDPISFYTYALYACGAEAVGSEFAVSYSCSTNSMQNVKNVGAGWLKYQDEYFNLFGLSRQSMDSTSVFAKDTGRQWTFERLLMSSNEVLRSLGTRLHGIHGASPEEAFNAANHLLSEAFGPEKVQGAFFGESVVTELLLEHLQSETSLISRILFDDDLRSRILASTLEYVAMPGASLLPFGTDFFWLSKGGKLRAANVYQGELVSRHDGGKQKLKLSREAIIPALREGNIVPNLFLTFSIIGALPSVRLLGGHRQIFYYPKIQSILSRSISKSSEPDDQLLAEELSDTHHGWIVGLQFRKDNPIDVIYEYGSQTLRREFDYARSTFLRDAVTNFPIPTIDPTWAAAVKFG